MKKNNKGFSLVELIVVIAVMAVLVVVLAPAYLRYVDKARLNKDVAAVGEVINAVKVAAAEEKVLEELTPNTVGESRWTYVQIGGSSTMQTFAAEESTSSAISAMKMYDSMEAPENLTVALGEIVGKSIDFAREEIQEATIWILFAYDENYNIIAKVDISQLEQYEDIKAAFEAAFDCSASSTAGKLAAIQQQIDAYNQKYAEYLEKYGDAEKAAEAMQEEITKTQIKLEAAKNYEDLKSAAKTAQDALDAATELVKQYKAEEDDLKSKIANASGWNKTKLEIELGIKQGLTAGVEATVPGLQSALNEANTKLDNAKKNEQSLQENLTKLEEDYKQFDDMFAAQDDLAADRNQIIQDGAGLAEDVGKDVMNDLMGQIQGNR